MSTESWMKEFMPIEVYNLNVHKMTEVELIEHSLTKWIGHTKENLAKHGFGDGVYFDGCALCRKYYRNDCISCPLQKIGDCCVRHPSTFEEAHDHYKPSKLIDSLARCLDVAIKEEG